MNDYLKEQLIRGLVVSTVSYWLTTFIIAFCVNTPQGKNTDWLFYLLIWFGLELLISLPIIITLYIEKRKQKKDSIDEKQ